MMPHLGVSLEMRQSQECPLCQQEIFAKRQLPINTIVLFGYGVCPSCRQFVKPNNQKDQQYQRRWEKFIKGGFKLDT
jgi:hypothetical protein